MVAALSDCQCEQLDAGGGSAQLPDSELRDAYQHRLGILEITSTVVREIAAFRRDQAKHRIVSTLLRFHWFIVTRDSDASMKALEKELPPPLVQAEQKGFTPRLPVEVVSGFSFRDGEEPQTSLSRAGVRLVNVFRVRLESGQGLRQAGGVGPEMVTAAVEAELGRADNIAKLSTAVNGERCELFVWLDDGTAGMALVTPRLFTQHAGSFPTDDPTLPDPVTRVWAATGPNDQDVLAWALWVADGGARRVVPPPRRLGSVLGAP